MQMKVNDQLSVQYSKLQPSSDNQISSNMKSNNWHNVEKQKAAPRRSPKKKLRGAQPFNHHCESAVPTTQLQQAMFFMAFWR